MVSADAVAAGTITSVLGPVDPADWGPTDCHGHLFIRPGLPVELEPDFLLDDVEVAVREATAMRGAGGRVVVDCMPLGVGRDVDGLVAVAQRSKIVVIASTGFHRDRYYRADHWVRHFDAERIAELMVAEWIVGMDRSGYSGQTVDRTPSRPGAIKVATTGDEPTPVEAKLLVAVAYAAVATGLPVITHTDSFPAALLQLDVLERNGVAPDRVILSHMDRHCDADQLAEACASGATVCLDWLGRLDRRPDQVVAALARDLVRRGHGDRVVLGQDLARRQYWVNYGGGPGLAHLFRTVMPMLASFELGPEEIEAIMVTNPRRAYGHA
jgi:phosphotriesterase-related protein